MKYTRKVTEKITWDGETGTTIDLITMDRIFSGLTGYINQYSYISIDSVCPNSGIDSTLHIRSKESIEYTKDKDYYDEVVKSGEKRIIFLNLTAKMLYLYIPEKYEIFYYVFSQNGFSIKLSHPNEVCFDIDTLLNLKVEFQAVIQ